MAVVSQIYLEQCTNASCKLATWRQLNLALNSCHCLMGTAGTAGAAGSASAGGGGAATVSAASAVGGWVASNTLHTWALASAAA